MATYGGRNDENTFELPGLKDGGKNPYYTIIDVKTGVITVYERQLFGDAELGTIKPGGKFEKGKDFNTALSEADRKLFLNEKVQKNIKSQAEKTSTRAQIENGATPAAAAKRTEELLKTGKMTTTPDADAATVGGDNISQLSELFNKIKDIEGTNKGISQELLRYPVDMAKNQDVIKFSLIKYKVKDITTSGPKLGTGDRKRIDPNAKVGSGGDRQILGTVILPVPGQIQDTNSATWSDDSANAGQLAAAGLGAEAATGGDVGKLLTNMFDEKFPGSTTQIKAALTSTLVGNATGVNLLGRAGGVVLNPNLELLFSKPSLREFTLTFRLSARSKEEGLEIIKIIRFFKQGMAPIREASNLFLKAPNTFQVHYLLRGDTSGEHPFIGRMKECALTSVNTNYTPENNYATYEDGLMVSYQITLTLKELEPVYNDNYQDIPSTEIGF
jgi:hypothetical protein